MRIKDGQSQMFLQYIYVKTGGKAGENNGSDNGKVGRSVPIIYFCQFVGLTFCLCGSEEKCLSLSRKLSLDGQFF